MYTLWKVHMIKYQQLLYFLWGSLYSTRRKRVKPIKNSALIYVVAGRREKNTTKWVSSNFPFSMKNCTDLFPFSTKEPDNLTYKSSFFLLFFFSSSEK